MRDVGRFLAVVLLAVVCAISSHGMAAAQVAEPAFVEAAVRSTAAPSPAPLRLALSHRPLLGCRLRLAAAHRCLVAQRLWPNVTSIALDQLEVCLDGLLNVVQRGLVVVGITDKETLTPTAYWPEEAAVSRSLSSV